VIADAGSVFHFATLLPILVMLLAIGAMGLMFLSVFCARAVHANGDHAAAAPDQPDAGALARVPLRTLPQSVKLALLHLRRLVAGGAGVYEVPWLVAVGVGGADLDRLLPDPLPWPSDLAGAHREVLGHVGRISFCRTGAVLGFDDGLLDGPQWRQRWSALIRALQRCRPGRPLDGLVVVIAASELQTTADRQDQLVTRGDQIYHLIWSVQRMTGWRIPVYLLVSGCEELAGFADWVLALPRQARQQVLGWSVPYALDTVFEPNWIDGGMAELGQQLSIAQLLLMMPEPEVGVAEGLLLFPAEVQRLATPLSVLLTSMLRTSAYHEAFMFRGFFLAGHVPGGVTIEARSDAFAEALFTDKVFPEHKLAQPAYGELTRRHRQIRIAQAGLAATAFLCLFGFLHIRKVEGEYSPVRRLLNITEQAVAARALQTANPQAAGAPVRNVALSLLNEMAEIGINRIDTIAAPTSRLTFANARVEQAIARGYEVAVLLAAYNALREEPSLVTILDPASLPGSAEGPPDPRQALSTTVQKILEYDKHLQVYQRITTRPGIDEVGELMEAALDVRLPAGFTKNYQLYEDALSSATMRPIRTTDVQPIIEQILQKRYDAAVMEIYSRDPLVIAVKHLVSLGSDLATAQRSVSLEFRNKLLADIEATLDKIANLLGLPAYEWLSGKPDPAFILPSLDRLKGVQVVRTDFIDGLRARAAKTEAERRERLLRATAFDGARVLTSGDGAVILAPPMTASRGLLNELFSQPFMRPLPAVRASAPPASGTRINWDTRTLRQAEEVAESYLAFAPKDDGTLPQSIQRQVLSVAGDETAAHIGPLLTLAAEPASDHGDGSRAMLQEVSGLAGALPILVNLRNILRQAGAAAPAGALDKQVSEQAVRLLRQVDNNLVSAAPYQLADPRLSFWHGSPPLAEPAFGTNSPTDLASTLPPRRDFVETLAREYGAPLVSYLRDPGTSSNGSAAGIVARWQSILDTLDRYHRSDPSNSLTRLEQFITVDMDKIDLSNCRELSVGGVVAGNYFDEQLQNIRRAVASRCGTVVHAGTEDRYTSLSTAFNAQLAGRFPFAPVAGPDPGATGPVAGAADPNDVRRFLIEYGPDLATLQAQFQAGGAYGEAGRAAEAFLSQLLAVQSAFAPMLADPSGNAPLSYQVDVEFFANPAAARGQNQVIDAALSGGNQRASSMNGTSRMIWTMGQPLRVDLRWATNAPMVPDGSAHRPSPRISGLTAGFDFSDSWALLRLIRAQAPSSADLNALQDRRPEVVAFDVPLKRNSNAATGGNTELDTARVYMRLALTGILHAPGQPEKTVPVALPEFPTAAPLLGPPMSYIGRATNPPRTPPVLPTARSALQ
jgi:type VI secretion system protein ImpL